MQKQTIIPLQDRLIVKPIEEENKSVLALPQSAKETPQVGLVITVGPGKDGIPLVCKAGDKVLYRKGAGIKIPGDDGHLMMKEGVDVIGVYANE